MWMRRVRVDPNVRAVIVRVDSPGGSAIASEVIWREIKLTRDVKPVVVSMGDVAASGGYYIAAPAHAIVAQPGTITGSIGVVTGKFVLKGTADKLGIGVDAVSDGPMSQIYSPFRPFSAEERAARRRADEGDLRSVRLARRRRTQHDDGADPRRRAGPRLDRASGQGERGLVDELGGLDVAIRIAKERAKLDPTQRRQPRRLPAEALAVRNARPIPFGRAFGAGECRACCRRQRPPSSTRWFVPPRRCRFSAAVRC